jgi:5'-nucleotidase
MSDNVIKKLIVAVSSRALFDLAESHDVFEKDGVEAYAQYQIAHENEPLNPGPAFTVIRKLLSLNNMERDLPCVEVILLSKNSTDTGLRVFKSIEHHELAISRAAFTTGGTPYQYASAFGAHLFLSMDPVDVRMALKSGIAAATILPNNNGVIPTESNQLRIAFDGDAVLFSDEAEKIYQDAGLEAFEQSEKKAADRPLPGGPFQGFLAGLFSLQQNYPPDASPIRTALVTARSAPTHERVIKTLRAWKIRIDETLFLGGMDKGKFLKAFRADIFFDDRQGHCESACQYVPTGHVPDGVKNQ